MADFDTQINVGMNVDGVVSGTEKAKRSVRDLGESARGAGKSLGGIGDGAGQSADKVEQATKRQINSLRLLTAELESGGRATRQYQEAAAAIKGNNLEVLKPYLDQLDAAKAKQLASTAALASSVPVLDKIGISAKQTAAALRGVPAQFTDIVTSIQGGQAPLTVFLQQGGQLKDMFGGAGNAAKALGGYVVGLINPLTLAVGAVGALGYAAYKASEDAKALNKALILSNGATGASITDLNNYERALVKSGIASSTATAALVEFVGAGVKATAGLQEITKAAIDLEKVGGAAVKDTAKAFAELAKDPLSSLQTLTLETYKQVQALSDQGDQLGAVAVAQQAYKESIELQTVALKAQEGPLDVAIRSWKSYGTAISEAGRSLATAVLGTPQTGNEQRAQLQQRRDTYAAQGYDTTKEDAQLAYFKRLDDAQNQSIANQRRDLELKNLLDKFNREDTAGKKQRELNQGITDYSKLLESGQITVTQYAAAIKKLSEVKEAGAKSQITDDIKGLNLYNDLLSKSAGYSANYAENVGLLSAAFAKGRIDLDGLKEAMKQLNSEQQINKDAAKAQEDQLKAVAKAQESYVKEQLKSIEAAEKSAKSAGDTLQKYLDEEQALTLAAAKNISLAQAIAEVELARLREAQSAAIANKANEGVLLALDEEIKKREQIVQAIGRKENREAATNAAKEAASEWKKAAEQIEQSITDALLRGFEAGKGFAENLRDVTVNMFKSMVLEPTIRGIVSNTLGTGGGASGGIGNTIGSSISNALGIAGIGSAFGGAMSSGYALAAGGNALATMGAGASMVGSATGAASAAAGVGQIVGAAAQGVTSALAAIPGWGWAAMAVLAIANMKGEYVQSLGESVATVDATNAVRLGGSGGTNDVSIGGGLNIRQTETSDKFTSGLASAFVKAAQSLGIGTSGASFGFGSNNSDGGKFGITSTVGGQTYKTGDIKTSEAALQLEASRAVFFALQSSELPGYLSKVFNGITASTAAQADIDAALNYAGGLKQIRDALTETRTPLQVLQDSVSSAFTALGTSADTFKTDFVSAIDAGISPDKLAQFQQLGANLDALAQSSGTAAGAVRSLTDIANERKTLDERFAQATLTDQQLIERTRNALDESNRARFDEVLAVEKTKAALIDSASEMSRVAGIVSSQQTQLLNAAGLPVNASGSRDGQSLFAGSSDRVQIPRTIAELNASLDAFGGRAYQNADASGVSEYAKSLGLTAQNLQSVLDKLASDDRAAQAAFSSDGTKGDDNARYAAMATGGAADTSARDAANALATERKALQDQLDDLQFSTAEKAAKARAAISEENRALFDQLEQVRATKTAAEEAAQALEKFTGAMRSLTDTNADLQIKLLEAQGNTTGAQAAARARDIARLTAGFSGDEAAKLTAQYDANESLKAQIEALTKSQQDAASAANTLKSAWASVTDSLLDQVDRIRGKLAADSLDSIGAQQARFTIATAQARAGDLDAAKRLGGIGDALIGSVTADATNRLERIKIQAQVAESLQTTASLLGGTPTPVLSAQFPQQQSTVQLEQNIASLTAQVALLKGHLAEIQTQTKRTADAVNGAGEAPMAVEVD